MTRIIVRMPNWIGDFVMATAFLEELSLQFPDAIITTLCSSPLEALLENNPFVHDVISFSRQKRFFPRSKEGFLLSVLRKRKYDIGFLLTNSFSSAWLFWAGGVKKRIGFAKKVRKPLLTKNVPFPLDKERRHLVETYKTLLPSPSTFKKPKLFIPKEKKALGKTYIGINPGAAYGTAKCWLPERFHTVASRLAHEIPGSHIFFFGDKSTAALIDSICQGLPDNVHNLAGHTTLRELTAKIGSLDVLLTNDSGPMHMAAAMQVPLVALFGSTNDTTTGPYQWGEVIHKRVSCSPCYKRVCPIDFRCMKQIESDEVTNAVKKALLLPAISFSPTPLSLQGLALPKIATGEPFSHEPKTAAIILAAGMGRRLGLSYPKGQLQVGDKSLYEILIAKAKGRPVAIMTSPATHKATQEFLQEKGLSSVLLFQTRMLPRLTASYEESPEGNGALYSALVASSIWEKWHDIEKISVIPIDNPLSDPFDPRLLEPGVELSVKAILKESGEEKLGSLFEKNGHLYVTEYFELPPGCENNLGYSGCFSCDKSFFEKAAHYSLPWHKVERSQGFHFERFVFDAFPLAESYNIILGDRKKEFAPIKTVEDLATLLPFLYNL